ncbi:hypothetical protein POSPLADRAFT_1128328 [Postia placenta MAD-698-R-SB12]|uniref:Actin-like ATPase domain-containing protein n=1 Tax=Postia placenta MAD-698-R-SB12 TaxID=670580 RepID=A0A1X6NHL7_9APHY|nr:hypothetical protein POSPLADRAFT_1128328 [Postia placenta MAD-698-R-SB12]OSX68099.1 hypothetical protein POSPLADRAFT_1128328 [Postia placenta MAD-698-R-SB12]
MAEQLNITRLPPLTVPSLSVAASYDQHRGKGTPLIIDNGSTHLRFGFCTSNGPRSQSNAVAKYKERRTNKPLLLFGDGIEAEGGAKSQVKTPWEGDVLLNFDALENALDYAFIQLGIDTPSIEHPVLMTERLCSPLHSRSLTSELMFEQYCVPSLAFCVDSVMSFYYNNLPSPPVPFSSDGLVVSFNTASTSVIPVLNGKGLMSHAKRIPWGASQATDYLLKLIQLKYPTFPTRVTTMQTNWMLQNFCEFSIDYPGLLRRLKDPLSMRASERILQFPFTLPTIEEKTEEELARIAERKREQGRKLQEIAAKARQEKLAQKENDLQHMLSLRERRDEESKKEWAVRNTLQEEGFDDDAELDSAIKKLENDLKKVRKKDADGDELEDEPPSFPLLDVPDADLEEDQLKEKRKQRLMKAGYEARERAKREKEREREEREAEERREVEERERDLAGWASKLKKEQEAIMNKIKERNRRRAALNDRKSAAAQARMKSIANLAADDRVPKKRRKGGGEDLFGADDADWAIYRKINNAAPSSDEEEDMVTLQAVEQKLLQHDPSFTHEHTHASLSAQRSALLTAFRPQYDDGDVEGKSRIHLNIERWRVCEAWFSPNMAGVDSAGLGEIMQNVLSRFSDQEKGRLVKNVFVTGGPSQLPELVPRMQAMLRPILPPEMPLEIVRAADPMSDAWKGMADFAKTDEFTKVGVTKEEYEEWGGERIKRWWGGNWNSSIPLE